MKDPRKLTDEDVVVVCNTVDMPHPVLDVSICKCDFCDAEIWFANSTKNRLVQDGHDSCYYMMCIKCASIHAQEAKWSMPSDEQLREVAEQVGATFDQVKENITNLIVSHNLALDTWPKEN